MALKPTTLDKPGVDDPMLPVDFIPNSFAKAIEVAAASEAANVYTADLKRDWVIGLVPHGGYINCLLAHAASLFMQAQHGGLQQPDLITSHMEFLTRATVGPCKIQITVLKLGRQFSTLRVQLLQNDARTNSPRVCCECMLLQGNLSLEAANNLTSLPTPPLLEPAQIPRPSSCVPWDVDPLWPRSRPAAFKMETLFPPSSPDNHGSHRSLGPSVKEQWVRWTPASCARQKFTVSSLPFLVDAFRPVPEAFGLVGMWYPTVSYGLDVRRGGEWEWLFVRVSMYEVRHGRFGMDVVLFDEQGAVVATSRHVALIVDGARNVKGRMGGEGEKNKEMTKEKL